MDEVAQLRDELARCREERDRYRDRIVYLEKLWDQTLLAVVAYYEGFDSVIRRTSPLRPDPGPVDPDQRRPLGVIEGGVAEDGGDHGDRLPPGVGDVSQMSRKCSGL